MDTEQTDKKVGGLEVDLRVDLAVERTMLANERTQLAWVRTVLGFITGGIAIDKGVSALHQARLLSGEAWEKNGHFAGLLMTSVGTALMVLVTVLFIKRLWELSTMMGRRNKLFHPGTLISVFMIIVGTMSVYLLTIDW